MIQALGGLAGQDIRTHRRLCILLSAERMTRAKTFDDISSVVRERD